MYVVKYKNMVVLGIIPWNSKYIMDVMRVRYRITLDLPYQEPSNTEFPMQINDDTIIYPAEENRPIQINTLIEQYYGPLWEFQENKIIANYEVRSLDLESAKSNYKVVAANWRYQKEISGTKISLNGKEYFIETSRESRMKYIERLISMTDDSIINFKFNTGWETLNKSQVLDIVNTIDNHVQFAFNDELTLSLRIDQATNIQDLLAIEELNK